jgi:histidine triad (HIT) family protein
MSEMLDRERNEMGSCLFCDIAAGKIPCTKVHSDEKFLAFRDIDPKAPTHILVIPRHHITRLSELKDSDSDLAGELLLTAARIATGEGLDEDGYRFVINCGQDGGQTVGHLHLHILGGRPMEWPPG